MDLMSNIFEWFKENLKEFPLYISLLVFGGLGAAYSNFSSAKKLNRKQRFVSITFGAFTALFLAILIEPVVLHLWDMKLSGAAMSAIGFFSGHLGLEGVARIIIRRTERRVKKESKKEDK